MLNSNSRPRAGGYRFERAGAAQAASDSKAPRTAIVQGGINSGFTPLIRPSAFAVADMNDLLDAVKSRLRLCVAERAPGLDAAATVRSCVLECAAALDLLQVSLARELNRHQQLELDVFDAQSALAQARVELATVQAVELRARHRALHDSLTSLPNRSLLRQRLDDALNPGPGGRQALAVLYVDLDDFQAINQEHGRELGDELLRVVSARLVRAVRNGDLVSRLGSDEFACLLAELPGRQQLRQLACKLFDAVSAPVTIGKLALTVRPSIGIAVCPDDGVTSEDLLRSADAAMASAKRQQTGYAFAGQDGAGAGSD